MSQPLIEVWSSVRTIQVKVKPNARSSSLEEVEAGLWLAQLKSPPVDGKANAALIEFLAKKLGIAKSRIIIIRGETSRRKTILISDIKREQMITICHIDT